MTKEDTIHLRACLIELDKGIMIMHSAIRGVLSMLEKVEPVTLGENDTITELPQNKV